MVRVTRTRTVSLARCAQAGRACCPPMRTLMSFSPSLLGPERDRGSQEDLSGAPERECDPRLLPGSGLVVLLHLSHRLRGDTR